MENQGNNFNYLFGKNPIREKLKTLKSGELFIRKSIKYSTIIDIIKKAKSKNIKITYCENSDFQSRFGECNAQGLVLKIREEYTNYLQLNDLLNIVKEKKKNLSIIVILDGIEDVGNFGAVLRNSLLFGVDGVILPKNNSAPINEVVAKRSAGALAHLNIIYATNIVVAIQKLKEAGYWIYGADKGGEKLPFVEFNEKTVLVFGNENKGIRDLVKKNCDATVTIPTNEKLDSLNLAVSTGIILYELNRK